MAKNKKLLWIIGIIFVGYMLLQTNPSLLTQSIYGINIPPFTDNEITTRTEFLSSLPLQSSFGDTNCCYACQSSSTKIWQPGQSPITVDCGVSVNKALVDIYISTDGNVFVPTAEAWNPITLPYQGISNKWWKAECYKCTTGTGTGTAGLDFCTKNSDCTAKGSNYICDGGACHLNCNKQCSESTCNNGKLQRTCTRPSGCAEADPFIETIGDCSGAFNPVLQKQLIPNVFIKEVSREVKKNCFSPSECSVSIVLELQNKGQTKLSQYLLELQVRPRGQPVQSIVSPTLGTCDNANPQNVHKTVYNWERLEQVKIDLQTSTNELGQFNLAHSPTGEFDIYLISVNKCYNTQPTGNVPLPPYEYAWLIDSIDITPDNPEEERIVKCDDCAPIVSPGNPICGACYAQNKVSGISQQCLPIGSAAGWCYYNPEMGLGLKGDDFCAPFGTGNVPFQIETYDQCIQAFGSTSKTCNNAPNTNKGVCDISQGENYNSCPEDCTGGDEDGGDGYGGDGHKVIPGSKLCQSTKTELKTSRCKTQEECGTASCVPYDNLPNAEGCMIQNTVSAGIFTTAPDGVCVSGDLPTPDTISSLLGSLSKYKYWVIVIVVGIFLLYFVGGLLQGIAGGLGRGK